ncbi:MAG: hypothetical protein PUP91_16865 [Rhizonema sp. PD37]|nr:hypothetical protein [Rhizonema sp. PD37]
MPRRRAIRPWRQRFAIANQQVENGTIRAIGLESPKLQTDY